MSRPVQRKGENQNGARGRSAGQSGNQGACKGHHKPACQQQPAGRDRDIEALGEFGQHACRQQNAGADDRIAGQQRQQQSASRARDRGRPALVVSGTLTHRPQKFATTRPFSDAHACERRSTRSRFCWGAECALNPGGRAPLSSRPFLISHNSPSIRSEQHIRAAPSLCRFKRRLPSIVIDRRRTLEFADAPFILHFAHCPPRPQPGHLPPPSSTGTRSFRRCRLRTSQLFRS